MNTAMTVTTANNSVQVMGSVSGTLTGGSVGSYGGYCYGCSTWPCACHNHAHYHYYSPLPSYSYTVSSPDKAALLKAWLDGFMTDRKMTEKALAIVRKKLEEYAGA